MNKIKNPSRDEWKDIKKALGHNSPLGKDLAIANKNAEKEARHLANKK